MSIVLLQARFLKIRGIVSKSLFLYNKRLSYEKLRTEEFWIYRVFEDWVGGCKPDWYWRSGVSQKGEEK